MIYKEMREKFSVPLWFDLVSKSDLLKHHPAFFITEDIDADHLAITRYGNVSQKERSMYQWKMKKGLSIDPRPSIT